MATPNESPQSPFLDASSFEAEETEFLTEQLTLSASPLSKPFLSVYEIDESGSIVDPATETYVEFLNELYDEEFDEALFELVNEAASLYEERFEQQEYADPGTTMAEAEQFLQEHFAPLVQEAETMLEALAAEFDHRELSSLNESEVEAFLDAYQPATPLSPSFENFWGALKKVVKKVAKVAKKGIKMAASLGLGPILKKVRRLINPLLKKVLQAAIGKLPTSLQPPARMLAKRLPFLKEVGEESLSNGNDATRDITEIQQEFNLQIANLLFANSEVEQELEVTQAVTDSRNQRPYSLAELDEARFQFIDQLSQLKEGEDPTPYVENFIPAILPALKIGIKLIGRKKVVKYLAKYVARLIKRFIGPKYAPALSRAIVDAGLRLIHLEASPEDEASAANAAVAATVEDTIRRVAALPEYVLDNEELLEGFTLEAFEQAAAANLPPILSEETYQKRPELLEAKGPRGTWLSMPLHRRKRKRYKKYSRILKTKISPHKAMAIKTFGGVPLSTYLQDTMGIPMGSEIEAELHLYEGVPGTMLPQLSQLEHNTPGLGTNVPYAYTQLHPFIPEAASMLIGEPCLGRAVAPRYLSHRRTTAVGQRFYRLVIPGARPVLIAQGGRHAPRRTSSVKLTLDFPANQVRVYLFLSEVTAQHLAVKVRQNAGIGTILPFLGNTIEQGLHAALNEGLQGKLKIIHEALAPDTMYETALNRLPPFMTGMLQKKLKEWLFKALMDYFKQQAQQFVKATEDTADGVTLQFTMANPPGLDLLRQLLKGKASSLGKLSAFEGTPTINVHIKPGYANE